MNSNLVEAGGTTTALKGRKDLKKTILDILKTYAQLPKQEGRGFTFVARVLRGEHMMAYNDGEPIIFKRFGAKKRMEERTLLHIMHHAERMRLIEPVDETYCRFRISEKGQDFIKSPHVVPVLRRTLGFSYPEFWLREKLSKTRREIAAQRGMETYNVFSNFTLDRIATEKPESLTELKSIPGMNQLKAELYGASITGLVRECNALIRSMYYQRVVAKAGSKTSQEVKVLFNEGRSLEEIAKIRSVKESTIRSHLEALHLSGDIDLRPWIEENLDGKLLYKGSEYFKNVSNHRLKQAYETLGMDYDALRLCRLYVSDFQSSETKLELTGS